MARSTYVYVAIMPMFQITPKPVATFTVKHELAGWLKGLSQSDQLSLRAFRYPDGNPARGAITELNVKELING